MNLLDRFLFDNVMEDPNTCRDILSICLGTDIPPIVFSQKEKVFEISNMLRTARLDIFSFDETDTAIPLNIAARKIPKLNWETGLSKFS